MSPEIEFVHKVSTFSYIGVFGIVFLIDIIPFTLMEIVLLAVGYIIGIGKLSTVIVIIVTFFAVLLGDSFRFFIVRGKNPLVLRIYQFILKPVLSKGFTFSEEKLPRIIFLSRFLPKVHFLGPALAAKHGVSFRTFFTYNTLAVFIYIPLFLGAGIYMQDRVDFLVSGIAIARNIIYLGLGVLLFIVLFGILRTALFGNFILSKEIQEGYVKTFIPGLQKKIKPLNRV